MTACDAEPPLPVQFTVKLVEALSAAVAWVPLVASAPDQPPDAVQEAAFVEDQVSVEVPPLETLVGFALSATVGAGVDTDTVTD